MGICYYCGKPGNNRAKLVHNEQLVNLCDFHYKESSRIQDGRNAGYQAGIA